MSAVVVTDGLVKEAKAYLGITWDGEEETAVLSGQIMRGIAYIADKTGVERSASVFETGGNERAQGLLFAYLLYDRAGALDQYAVRYAPEINSLRRKQEVERHASRAED